MKKHIQTIFIMFILIAGLAMMIASWYVIVGIAILFVSYNIAKYYVILKGIMNE